MVNGAMRIASLVLSALLALAPSVAQGADTFNLDTVLVAPFEGAKLMKEDENRIREAVSQRLGQSVLIVEMGEVEKFDEGYDAWTYMASCPPGQHEGCAAVIGERGKAEWVVTGSITQGETAIEVNTIILSIKENRSVLDFKVTLTPENEAAYPDGVADVLARILEGAHKQVDIRERGEDPQVLAQLEKEQEAEIARGLLELEQSLGEVVRAEVRGELTRPKLTREKLDEMAEREDGAPWERLEMTRAEYKRFKETGWDRKEWARWANGRFGELILRVGFGGGVQPYGQAFDGRYALSDVDLTVVQQVSFGELRNGGVTGADFELGFGVWRFLEVTGVFGLKSAPYEYTIYQEVVGQTVIEKLPIQDRTTTFFGGARITFVPLPTYRVRPMIGAGFLVWKGRRIDEVVALSPNVIAVEAPNLFVVQLLPGVEVSPARQVDIFVRAMVDLPVAGQKLYEFSSGEDVLVGRAFPTGKSGVGIGGQAGVTVKIGLIKPKVKNMLETFQLEDEDEDL